MLILSITYVARKITEQGAGATVQVFRGLVSLHFELAPMDIIITPQDIQMYAFLVALMLNTGMAPYAELFPIAILENLLMLVPFL